MFFNKFLAEAQSSQSELNVGEAKTSPLRPSTLVDTLPLVPGVARTPDGRITIEGTDEFHSTLLINSVNVTDPATGNVGLSIPVDSVDIVKVSLSPYLAQYGSFTAGVVSAETRRVGDKWNFNLNDPLPEFRIRSGHLEGLRRATPRVDFGGPLVVHRGSEVFEASVPHKALENVLTVLRPLAAAQGVKLVEEIAEVRRLDVPEHAVGEVVRGLLNNAMQAPIGQDGYSQRHVYWMVAFRS